ncbi:hypothetical protein G3545_26860 [Starkeya sp. ORNL1]|uniref:hypothetical protein n=1 Tax=Starkeya sp. ORNL1 TaxID=2709380 RepID=UPI0014636DF6|nr:hypothetical protein [Starkeya sp. ORNL1]QJP16944.1 hypothetical protein G3545_26860 [Starkeya sp. ORNL1]
MAKFVIFGVKGDAAVWLADLEHGTVEQVSPAEVEAAGAAEAGFLTAAIKARQFGYTLVKDVDLAVATTTRSDAAAAHMSC